MNTRPSYFHTLDLALDHFEDRPRVGAPAVSGHTPGPWHCGGIFDPDSDRPSVNVWGPTRPGKQSGNIVCRNATIADGRLIAAAPELLSALNLLLDTASLVAGQSSMGHLLTKDMERARAALAKAAGL